MSSERDDTIGGLDFRLVADVAQEPSYVSEIGRKLREADMPLGYRLDTDGQTTVVLDSGEEPDSESDLVRSWGNLSAETAARKAAGIVNLAMEADDNEFGSEKVGAGQEIGSPKYSWAGDGLEEVQQWQDYKLVRNTDRSARTVGNVFENTGLDGLAERLRDVVNVEPWVPDGEFIDVADKREIIQVLSEQGNEVSRNVELIAQDVFDRQFRYMDTAVATGYSDPRPDYEVYDGGQMDYRLMIEVTTRWVNPVDKPYMESKKNDAFEEDADLLVMGPKFRNDMVDKYGVVGDEDSMVAAETDLVNLVRVPPREGKFFDPFLLSVSDIPESPGGGTGNPIIVPDRSETRQRLDTFGRVGSRYPVVDGEFDRMQEFLEYVQRDYNVVSESQYRNMVREALEPVFYNFTRPYRIEQFLIDTYWEGGMLQREIAEDIGVSTSTIQTWMDSEHWNIITRGFAGVTGVGDEGETTRPLLSDETGEIWERMYRGTEPFDREHTGYEIQTKYNRHPVFDLDDWRRWEALSDEERAEITASQDPDREGLSYTIMLGPEDRLMPSYSYIISVLRDRGIEIREGFFGESGVVYPTRKALEYMVNTNIDTFGPEGSAETVGIKQMRSSLEVEFAEFLSGREVPFAYEQLRIPGLYTVQQEAWNETLRRIGDGAWTDEELALWTDIFEKHNLDEPEDVVPREVLEMFDKREIVPDFVLYEGEEKGPHGPEWDGWGEWTEIVEIGGAWGMTAFPAYSDWYRLQGVAFKEFAFRKLGLWDDVTFVIQDSESITTALRTDDNYVIAASNQMESGFDGIGEVLFDG